MSDLNQVDDAKVYCESIAKSISDIIRFSLNEEYRKKSCELFGVFSTKDAETEISKRLMSVLENKNSEKRRKSSKKKSKENIPEEDILGASSMSTECSSEIENMENTVQGNWLQISSQQCRKAVKRKKLKFLSQSNASLEKEFEFSSIQFSSSQPCEISSSSQVMDDRMDFCRKKFRESLMENPGKYLRKNLNYHGRLRF